MNVHMNANHAVNQSGHVDGELSLDFLKRFISYARRYFIYDFIFEKKNKTNENKIKKIPANADQG